jgi:hypothetical protein
LTFDHPGFSGFMGGNLEYIDGGIDDDEGGGESGNFMPGYTIGFSFLTAGGRSK